MTYQRPTVTADNRSPLIIFSTLLLIVSSSLTAFIKIITKYTVARALRSDDWFTFASLIFAVGQSIAVIYAARAGLGQPIASLSVDQINMFQKAVYSADLLYIISIALSKMVTLRFLAILTPEKRIIRLTNIVSILNLAWATVIFLPVCFQCQAPETWATLGGKCYNPVAFWSFASFFDILVDVGVTLLPIMAFRKLNTTRAKRIRATIFFSTRMLVIPITILRLYYIIINDASSDPTFNDFNRVLMTEIATNCSIIFACVSFVKPFLDNIETGMMASRIRHQEMGGATDRIRDTTLKYAKSLFHTRREYRSPSPDGNQFPLIAASTQSYEAQVWSDPSISEQQPVGGIVRDVEIRVE